MAQESEGKTKHLTLRLTEEQHRRIKVFAAEEGTTVKELVLRCIDQMIEGRRQAQQQESKE